MAKTINDIELEIYGTSLGLDDEDQISCKLAVDKLTRVTGYYYVFIFTIIQLFILMLAYFIALFMNKSTEYIGYGIIGLLVLILLELVVIKLIIGQK